MQKLQKQTSPVQQDTRTPIEILLKIDNDGMTTATQLYDFLGLNQSNYTKWCRANITNNKFAEEGKDYTRFVLEYHDGSGKVGLDAVEKNKIIPGNIKQGITVLGVEGTCEPSSAVTTQAKEVTPGTAQQVVLPDVGIDYLSQVTIKAIPYVESDNAAGGKTVTIAG